MLEPTLFPWIELQLLSDVIVSFKPRLLYIQVPVSSATVKPEEFKSAIEFLKANPEVAKQTMQQVRGMRTA